MLFRSLKARVRSYFSAAETRSRIREMVAIAEKIDFIKCATVIEAQIRELRLISEKQPRYNRRSRFQEKAIWVKLTNETFPRLMSARGLPSKNNARVAFGPFNSRESAQNAIDALHEVVNLRQCNNRNFDQSRKSKSACALFDMNRCGGACIGKENESNYETHVKKTIEYISINSHPVSNLLSEKMAGLATAERFEEAAAIKERLHSFLIAADRAQNLINFVKISEILISKSVENEIEIIHIKQGRLVGSAIANPMTLFDVVQSLKQSSEVIQANDSLLPAATYEESERLLSYLFSDQFEILEISSEWTLPVNGSGAVRHSTPAFN